MISRRVSTIILNANTLFYYPFKQSENTRKHTLHNAHVRPERFVCFRRVLRAVRNQRKYCCSAQ